MPRYKQLLDRLVPVLANQAEPPQASAHLQQVREQILTGLLRVGVVLGTLALLVAILPPLRDSPPTVLAIDFGILVAALRRRLDYRLRAGVLGHSQMLLEMQELMTPQEVDESLRAIARASQKMATIINELLLLAHVRVLESIPCEAFSTRSVIAEVEARLQLHAARGGNVDMMTALVSDLTDIVRIESGHLKLELETCPDDNQWLDGELARATLSS